MIHFRHAVAFDLQRLDLVAVLDGLEMLPGVGHHQQEQAGESDAELAHLSAAARIFQLHEARVVDRLGKVDLGRADRSEEHTSELSHSSISYAVFCLKKKKHRVFVASLIKKIKRCIYELTPIRT